MNITVTIGASPELLNAIQDLVKAFSGAKVATSPATKKQDKAVKTEEPVKSDETASAPTAELNPAIPGPSDTAVTIEQLRALVQKKAGTKKNEIKKLLSEYKTDSVTNLAKDHYFEFKEKIEAL
jgi:hypothetical protein